MSARAPSLQPDEDLSLPDEVLLEVLQEVLARGARFHFRAKGVSMTPFIKDGDMITIAPVFQEKPAPGKVVAFIHPGSGMLTVHRIVGRQGGSFLIRGDNAAGGMDGLVPPQAILGCITRVVRDGRRILLGQGPERFLIAGLSRRGWLQGLLQRVRSWRGKQIQSHSKKSPERL